MQLNGFNLERAYWKLLLWLPSLRLGTCWGRSDRPFQVQEAIMKHNIARGPNTMEFLISKFALGVNTMVKTIY